MEYTINKNEELVEYKKNDIIFDEIDEFKYVYYVIEGYVKVMKYSESGNEKIIDILTKDDFLAVTLMMEKRDEYGLNSVALTNLKLLRISVFDMYESLRNPDILKMYMEFQSAKTIHFKNYISSNESDEKILLILDGLYRRFGYLEDNQKVINIPVTKTELANFIGIRRETFSRKLSELSKRNLIETSKNKIILKT